MANLTVQPLERGPGTEVQPESLSSLMRKSFTNGQFWFQECLRAYDFDFLYWERLDRLGYGSGKCITDKVEEWAAAPVNQHIEKFVDDKYKAKAGYEQELKEFRRSRIS